MNIAPVFKALRRHKTAVILIILQIAVCCAILCNSIYVIKARVDRMTRLSGVAESELVALQTANLGDAYRGPGADAAIQRDLALLRGLPGVSATTMAGQFPYGSSSWGTSIGLKPEDDAHKFEVSMSMAGPGFADTLGLKLQQGRWFNNEEYADQAKGMMSQIDYPVGIITRSLANRLFPAGDALGKSVYLDKSPTRIVGIIDDLMRPDGFQDSVHSYDSILLPVKPRYGSYLLRVPSLDRGRTLAAAETVLLKADPDRIIVGKETLEEMRHQRYGRDRSVVWLLVIVSLCMLAISTCGIGGLVSFWVQQRTKQIGVRRALGATRGDILRHFQIENFLIVSGGIVLGMLLAFGMNQLLMAKYELPRLPWPYLPIGAVVLWLLGQLAILGPALRGASISPAIATRSA
ncbi:ABC transporter permease [Solilutibacter silvestris]|uniref:FtsX-like permease family protein n=1 Tax=Solilutibacter silvestris TaxID=1645665 RepID=A0A2K1Q1U6_9GAMM|nr:FtsX-like permease family protein [Lysobacter silvestris]PNS09012.1 FtsX-like permease family protein [Lysobacter silvestris]